MVGLALLLYALWAICRGLGTGLPFLAPDRRQPDLLTGALALQALLGLAALVGFGLRYRAHLEDLDRWLAFGATIWLFAELHAVFTPPLSSDFVSQSDFLRLLSYAILLVGVWRAIRAAEFGRAVADERARVAREIHDGLAQYLFAISAQTSLLAGVAELETVLPRLQEAAAAAQQEARFAVLALSSASGSAPFDSALNRYVEFLTADGELDVDLEIERAVELGPDEQIEVFRIVQEGLANVRRHAGARRATVLIGLREGQRVVRIADDGKGFEEEADAPGEGLRNMRARAAAIGGIPACVAPRWRHRARSRAPRLTLTSRQQRLVRDSYTEWTNVTRTWCIRLASSARRCARPPTRPNTLPRPAEPDRVHRVTVTALEDPTHVRVGALEADRRYPDPRPQGRDARVARGVIRPRPV